MGFAIFLIWIIFAFAVAAGAKNRGRSFGAYLALSIFLSPLIGGIILLALGEDKEGIEKNALNDGGSKKCPYCAEIIKQEAVICRYCGKKLPKQKKEEKPETEVLDNSDWICPSCGIKNPAMDKHCNCGYTR
ncbi:MAG: zinc ribbon domain-containing protein [Treponema sp.]|nr:zinc ribbon domain-containing protein [Treponema sp.]